MTYFLSLVSLSSLLFHIHNLLSMLVVKGLLYLRLRWWLRAAALKHRHKKRPSAVQAN